MGGMQWMLLRTQGCMQAAAGAAGAAAPGATAATATVAAMAACGIFKVGVWFLFLYSYGSYDDSTENAHAHVF